MSAAGVRGLRATYHRVLDKVELMLPEKLRPLYNHPAGNGPRMAPAGTFPPSPVDLGGSLTTAAGSITHSPTPPCQVTPSSFPSSLLLALRQPLSDKPSRPFFAPSPLSMAQTRTRSLGLILFHFRGHQGVCHQETLIFSFPPGVVPHCPARSRAAWSHGTV